MFPNRIEILSYPGPVPPLGKDNLMSKKVTARRCRNRRIGDFLKELHLAEGRGTGFPKIRRALEANGSPGPIFETDEERTYFLTTLHIHPESQVSGQVAGPVRGPVRGPVELTDIQYKILLECSTNPLSAKEITGKIGYYQIRECKEGSRDVAEERISFLYDSRETGQPFAKISYN